MISMTNKNSLHRALGAVLAALLAALLLSGCDPVSTKQSSTAPSPTQGRLVTVIKVLDGDTVVVKGAGTGAHDVVVRLLGVDAPEMNKAAPDKPAKQPECGAVAATEFLISMLIKNGRGVQVELVLDASSDHQDKYGRTLAYLQLADGTDSIDVNAAIIRSGHAAAWYPRGEPKPERSDSYEQLEAQAIASKAGLHAQCSVVGRS